MLLQDTGTLTKYYKKCTKTANDHIRKLDWCKGQETHLHGACLGKDALTRLSTGL